MGYFLLTVFLLVANGFFVAVEFALIASRRTKLEAIAEAGDRRAVLAIAASRELSLQLAGAQLGITMASLALGASRSRPLRTGWSGWCRCSPRCPRGCCTRCR